MKLISLYFSETKICPYCNGDMFGGIVIVNLNGVCLCQQCAAEIMNCNVYDEEFEKLKCILSYEKPIAKKDIIENDKTLRQNRKKIWGNLLENIC